MQRIIESKLGGNGEGYDKTGPFNLAGFIQIAVRVRNKEFRYFETNSPCIVGSGSKHSEYILFAEFSEDNCAVDNSVKTLLFLQP
jgi:hypothetical protein